MQKLDTFKNSKVETNDLRWECSRCQLLFGLVDQTTRRHLRIKVKDQIYWVVDAGSVSTGCRRCGAFNKLEDVNWKKEAHSNAI